MQNSRRVWVAAGVLGLALVAGAGLLRLANSQYRLTIQVVDSRGPVSSAWVAFGERDIVTTNPQGRVVFEGSRFELSRAPITVTDSFAGGNHLSQTLIAEISWNPLRTESEFKVQLPIVELERYNAYAPIYSESDLANAASAMPDDRPVSELNSARPLDEVELYDTSASPLGGRGFSVLLADRWSVSERFSLCYLSGLSAVVCRLSGEGEELRPPLSSHGLKAFVAEEDSNPLPASVQPVQLSVPAESGALHADHSTVPVQAGGSVRETVTLMVMKEREPLAEALVFMSRQKDSRIVPLGRTSVAGLLSTSITPDFFGEKITVVHPCCAPRAFASKTLHKKNGNLVVNVQSGKGLAVLVQHSAYGYLRNTASYELFSDSSKIAVSEQDGFAFYDAGKTPEVQLRRVLVRNGLPSEFFADGKKDQYPLTRYLIAANEPFIPAVALIETSHEKFHSGVLKSRFLRRWRRDFMARLMQTQSLRAVVSGETETRLALAGVGVGDVLQTGWHKTQLASEWDFAVAIDYDDQKNSAEIRLMNGRGSLLMKESVVDSDTLPERLAKSQFDRLLQRFPFESSVLSESDGEIELSFPVKKNFGLQSDSRLALYSHELIGSDLHKSQLFGFAAVLEGDDSGPVTARITHILPSFSGESTFPPVVRAVKVDRQFYLNEIKKSDFSLASNKEKPL